MNLTSPKTKGNGSCTTDFRAILRFLLSSPHTTGRSPTEISLLTEDVIKLVFYISAEEASVFKYAAGEVWLLYRQI